MKFQATKWPVTITLDVADDYTEGIDKENLKEEDIQKELAVTKKKNS